MDVADGIVGTAELGVRVGQVLAGLDAHGLEGFAEDAVDGLIVFAEKDEARVDVALGSEPGTLGGSLGRDGVRVVADLGDLGLLLVLAHRGGGGGEADVVELGDDNVLHGLLLGLILGDLSELSVEDIEALRDGAQRLGVLLQTVRRTLLDHLVRLGAHGVEGLLEDRVELVAGPLEEGEAVIHAARLRRAEAHEGRNTVSVGTGEGVRAHERAGDGAERADRDENSRIRPRFRLVGEEGVIFTALLRVRVERAVHASARHFLLGCQTARGDTRDAVTRSLASARVARRCDEFARGHELFFPKPGR